MAAPIIAAAGKWLAKKAGKKAVQKVASKGGGSKTPLLAGGAISVAVIGLVSLSMIMALVGAIGVLMGAMGGLVAGGAGAAILNECVSAEASPSAAAIDDIPPVALEAYQKASQTTGVDWVYIAAIGKIESDHGRFGGRHLDAKGDVQPTPIQGIPTAYGRAVGPMQFLTSTWANIGKDGNFDGRKDAQNIFDAALGTGFYLKVSGAPGDMRKAIFAYNHATWYVDKVIAQAKEYKAAAVNSTKSGSVEVKAGQAPPSKSGPNTVRLVQANVNATGSGGAFESDLSKIVSKAPDFITFNEVASRSSGQLTPGGYSSYRGSNTQARDVAVAWRTDKWDDIDKGYALTAKTNLPSATRYLSWVTLEDKKGHVVSVVSTQAMTNPYPAARRKVMGKYTETVNSLVDQLSAKGMVLVGGDVSVNYPRDAREKLPFTPYKGFKSSGLYSTYEMLGNHFATTGAGTTLDWIFTQKGRGLKAFRHGQFAMASDHNGVYADFKFLNEGGPATAAQVKATVNGPANGPVNGGVAGQLAGLLPVTAPALEREDGTAPGWTLPLRAGTYTLTARWGQRGSMWSSGYHTGLDFAAPTGTAVFAAAAGKVIPRPDQASWAGANFLTIDHGNIDGKSVVTWYAHLSSKDVNGGKVGGGTKIGAVGALGNVTGPHLHFEVRVNGKDVDPQLYLAGAGTPDAGGDTSDQCGATGSSGIVNGNGAWGGYQNGQIPLSAMCKLTFYNTYLECNAAKSFEQLNTAYKKQFHRSLAPVGGYRSYAAQVQCRAEKGSLCADPGTSNHGWGLAADLSNGHFGGHGTADYKWMFKNAPRYGWVAPTWARANGSKPEPWHWEYGGTGNNSTNGGKPVKGPVGKPPRGNGSATFIMGDWNVLGASHTEGAGCNHCGKPDSGPRMNKAVQIIRGKGIDVIALQEFQYSQQRRFKSLMPAWRMWGNGDNQVAWNSNKFRLVATSTFRIPYFYGASRQMPVVRLQHRASGTEIVVTSTHNPADTARGKALQWRNEATRIEGDLTRALASSGVPVYHMGDMNDRANFFCPFMSYGAMQSSAGGYWSKGNCNPPRSMGIDWIMGSRNNVTFHSHRSDNSGSVRFASDHPIITSRTTARN